MHPPGADLDQAGTARPGCWPVELLQRVRFDKRSVRFWSTMMVALCMVCLVQPSNQVAAGTPPSVSPPSELAKGDQKSAQPRVKSLTTTATTGVLKENPFLARGQGEGLKLRGSSSGNALDSVEAGTNGFRQHSPQAEEEPGAKHSTQSSSPERRTTSAELDSTTLGVTGVVRGEDEQPIGHAPQNDHEKVVLGTEDDTDEVQKDENHAEISRRASIPRTDSNEVGANSSLVVDARDLVASVRELCEQDKVEDALELVRTDLRNISNTQCTDIMHAFADAGRSDCALAALLHMQVVCVEVGASLDNSTYNALMLAYARDPATAADDGLEQAFGVLDLMSRANVDPDTMTFNRLMEACSAAAEVVDGWSWGLKVLDAMSAANTVPNVETFNTLLEACGKCGWSKSTGNGLEKGQDVLIKMSEAEIVPTTDTFNILTYGCAWAAGAGDGWSGVELGLDFLSSMAELNVLPDVITFNNLIAACAQAAGHGDGTRARDQAFRLLETMRKIGLAPDQGTCDTLVATCAKAAAAGDPEGVTYGLKVLEMVHEAELTPDPVMYNALLRECYKVAESRGPHCPTGWYGVAWISHILGLMDQFGADPNEVTSKTYNSLLIICINRVIELANEHQLLNVDTEDEEAEKLRGDVQNAVNALRPMGQGILSAEPGEVHTPVAGTPVARDSSRNQTPQSKMLWPQGLMQLRESIQPADREELFHQLQALASQQLKDLRALKADPALAEPGKLAKQVPASEGEHTASEHPAEVPSVPKARTSHPALVQSWEASLQQETSLNAGQKEVSAPITLGSDTAHYQLDHLPQQRLPQGPATDVVPRTEFVQNDHKQEEPDPHVAAAIVSPATELTPLANEGSVEGSGDVVHSVADTVQLPEKTTGVAQGHRRSSPPTMDMSDGTSLVTPWADDDAESSDERLAALKNAHHGIYMQGTRAPGDQNTVIVSPRSRAHIDYLLAGQSMIRVQQAMQDIAPGQGIGQHTSGSENSRRDGPGAARDELKKMGVEQVCDWLKGVGLSECVRYFQEAGIDGTGLNQLRDLQSKEVEVFYDAVEKRLGLAKFGLVLKLADALQEL